MSPIHLSTTLPNPPPPREGAIYLHYYRLGLRNMERSWDFSSEIFSGQPHLIPTFPTTPYSHRKLCLDPSGDILSAHLFSRELPQNNVEQVLYQMLYSGAVDSHALLLVQMSTFFFTILCIFFPKEIHDMFPLHNCHPFVPLQYQECHVELFSAMTLQETTNLCSS